MITTRNINFDLAAELKGNWLGDNRFRTALVDGLSLSFPRGERAFVDSVREALEHVETPDRALKEEIRGFVGQELVHAREHERYNETMCEDTGLDPTPLYRFQEERLAAVAGKGWRHWLATTVGVEHLTCLMARRVLSRPDVILRGAPPALISFWQWHSLEEIEHRSVADRVGALVGLTGGERRRGMLEASLTTTRVVNRNIDGLMKARACERPARDLLAGIAWLLHPQGLILPNTVDYLRFYWTEDLSRKIDVPETTAFADRYPVRGDVEAGAGRA